MKKLHLLKRTLLLFALIVGCVNYGWAVDPAITLTQSSLGVTGSSYGSGTKTIEGISFAYTDFMKSNSNIQAKASTGEIHNTTAFPTNIKSVAITHSGTARATTILGSTDGKEWTSIKTGSGTITGDFSGGEYKYFKITRGSNAAYWTQIVITYSEEDSSGETTTTTISADGITNTNKFISTTAGSLSASVTYGTPAAAVPEATVTWSGDNDEVATINSTTGAVTLVGAGTVTFTASYDGVADAYKSSSDTYEMTVIDEDPSLVTIWSEDFSDYSADDVPSGGTYSYVCVNGNSDTKIYENASAGGESPELLINKKGTNNGSFSATIPLNNGYTGTLKLQFKNNNTINVSAKDNNDEYLLESTSVSANTTTGSLVNIAGVTAETTSVTIEWSNSSGSNVRLDDIVLRGKEVPAKPTFSPDSKRFNSSFDVTISSAEGTTLKYTTDGTNPSESGTATSVDSNSKTITISGTEDVTVKAIAIKDEVMSAVASATYTYDTRTAPSFTLSDDEMTILVLSDDQTITLTTSSDGAVTFTSSDDTKLDVDNSVDSKVGVLSALEAGDYTVTVSTAETANFLAAEGTVIVHVVKKTTTMTVNTSFPKGTDLKDASTGSIVGIVKYNDAALSPQPTVTYTSSNTSVATVNASGVITFKKAGTTTITASFAGNDEYKECEDEYVLELIDTTPQDVEATIELNSTTLGTTAPDGVELTVKKITVNPNTGSASTALVADGEHLRMYKNSYMVVTAPIGYYLTSITLVEPTSSTKWDGEPTVSTGTYASKVWTGSANTVTFTFSGGQCRIASLEVILAPTVTISTAEYATYCNSNHNLDFSETGITVYTAEDNGETVRLNEVTSGQVPANTPVVLYKEGADGSAIAVPVIAEAAAVVVSNDLEVSDGTTAKGDGIYVLSNKSKGVGFYPWVSASSLSAGKVFLRIAGGSAREFIGFEEGETTSLREVRGLKADVRGDFYDLSGRKVAQPTKGLYIVNGRKVVIK